ncbi:MAG: VanZ family protein [Deltaproteobacteria bacterium]|nr:VanZ family protein [Deltaproteobacteria bacterium]
MDRKLNVQSSRLPGILCLILVTGYLIVGLWPFDFFPRNRVSWIENSPGLRFEGPETGSGRDAGGVAFTPATLSSGGQEKGRAFSIEILLRCDREPKGRLPNILAFCDRSKKIALMVGQWKTSLIVRKYERSTIAGRKWREIGVRDALPAGRTRLVTITQDDTGVVIYLDGLPAKRSSSFSPFPDKGAPSGHYLLLGNSPDASSGWSGSVSGVRLFSRALTAEEVLRRFESWSKGVGGDRKGGEGLFVQYRFAERAGNEVRDSSGRGNHLLIPQHPVFSRTILEPVRFDLHNRKSLAQDMIVNVAGFIPFGFIFPVWLGKVGVWPKGRILVAGIAAGFFVSLAIELTQGFIPVRSSSQLDVLCNTLGMAAGLIVSNKRKNQVRSPRSNHG